VSSSRHSVGRVGGDSVVRGGGGVPDHLTWYLVLLIAFLGLAGFFDSFATTFRYAMMTYVRAGFEMDFGPMVGMYRWVYLGSCLAFVPRVLADVWGRKAMLWTTMAGLCFLQWLVGFARTATEYIFLITVLSVFYKSDIWQLVISEEAPPRHRGLYAAVTAVLSACGGVALGGLVRQMGEDNAEAWRDVARFPVWGLFAGIPVVFFMRETRHFRATKLRRDGRIGLDLLAAPFRRAYRRPLVVLSIMKVFFAGGAIVAISLLGTEYLRVDNGFGPATVGRVVQYEVVAIMAAWLSAGYLSDRLGRHLCLYVFGGLYVAALLNMALLPKGSNGVVIAFVVQIFASMAVFAILRVATMELFPNDFRAIGSAWTDLFMTMFAAGTATLLGYLTHKTDAGTYRIDLSTCIIAAAAVALMVLPLFALLRETHGRRLEEV